MVREKTRPPLVPLQTIIECLKMATTGVLPPNTRSGQSFIHDPRVREEEENVRGGAERQAKGKTRVF